MLEQKRGTLFGPGAIFEFGTGGESRILRVREAKDPGRGQSKMERIGIILTPMAIFLQNMQVIALFDALTPCEANPFMPCSRAQVCKA